MSLKVKDTIQDVSPFYVTKIEINNFIYRNIDNLLIILEKSRGQAVLGRQGSLTTPWLTERHGYDPTSSFLK